MPEVEPELHAFPPVLNTKEASLILRTTENTIRRYVHTHQLRAIRVGRERRFRLVDVLDFVNRRPASNGMDAKTEE